MNPSIGQSPVFTHVSLCYYRLWLQSKYLALNTKLAQEHYQTNIKSVYSSSYTGAGLCRTVYWWYWAGVEDYRCNKNSLPEDIITTGIFWSLWNKLSGSKLSPWSCRIYMTEEESRNCFKSAVSHCRMQVNLFNKLLPLKSDLPPLKV